MPLLGAEELWLNLQECQTVSEEAGDEHFLDRSVPFRLRPVDLLDRTPRN